MVRFSQLTVCRGSAKVLDGAQLDIPAGTVTGLVAPNGSGKTTLLESIWQPWDKRVSYGIEPADAIRDARQWRRAVFYLPSPAVMASRESVRWNIELAQDCWGSSVDVEKLTARLGIEGFLDHPVRKCSQGMAQLAAVAAAMATGARILLLDEPMSALDPTNVGIVTRAMRSYVRTGRSIVMSIHNLANVDASCDRIAFIADGKVECVDGTGRSAESCSARYRELYGGKEDS